MKGAGSGVLFASLGFVGLDGVLGGWGGSDLSLLWSVLVKLHKLGEIELGLLEDLDLSDHAAVVLEWEDLCAALLLDLLANITFNPINTKLYH